MISKWNKWFLPVFLAVFAFNLDLQAQDFKQRSCREHRLRAMELEYIDINDMSISTKEAKQIKEELFYYSDRYRNKFKWSFYGGFLGLTAVGGVLTGIAGSENKALGLTGITCVFGGLVMIWPSMVYKSKAKEFKDKARLLIVDSTIEPVDLELGGGHLALGASLLHNEMDNTYGFGPSVTFRF